MRILFLIILSLMLNGYSWAYLTAGKIAVTATSSSSGVPSTSQDSDITDTKGSSIAVGVPVAVTGNVNIYLWCFFFPSRWGIYHHTACLEIKKL